jgi:hypothetical protein
MSRMPKLLFFALFFLGTMGGIWLNQNGYFGYEVGGPTVAFVGFAFALITSFLIYGLLRLCRGATTRFGTSDRDKASRKSLRF